MYSAILHDITARVQLTDSLKATANQLRTITDNVPALIAHVGADLRYRFVNRAHGEFFGREPEAVIGVHMRDVLRPEHYEFLQPMIAQVQAGQTVSFDSVLPDLGGDIRQMRVTYVPDAGPEGFPVSFHIMARDQTAEVRLARMLLNQVMHDELTGLPNRAGWNGELASAIARAGSMHAHRRDVPGPGRLQADKRYPRTRRG